MSNLIFADQITRQAVLTDLAEKIGNSQTTPVSQTTNEEGVLEIQGSLDTPNVLVANQASTMLLGNKGDAATGSNENDFVQKLQKYLLSNRVLPIKIAAMRLTVKALLNY